MQIIGVKHRLQGVGVATGLRVYWLPSRPAKQTSPHKLKMEIEINPSSASVWFTKSYCPLRSPPELSSILRLVVFEAGGWPFTTLNPLDHSDGKDWLITR